MKKWVLTLCLVIFFANHPQTDLIIFSFDRPMQLYSLLESVRTYVTGIDKTYVICRASNQDFKLAYAEVEKTFNQVTFLYQGAYPRIDFKELTLKAFSSEQPYVLFAVDDIIVKDYIDLDECVTYLEKTDGYGFYLRLGTNLNYCYPVARKQPVPPLQMISDDVCTWKFFQGQGDWAYPHTVDMTLYRKKDIKTFFYKEHYVSPNTLEARWASLAKSIRNKIGLCFKESKIVNLPLNRVQNDCHNKHMNVFTTQMLLELFNKGKRIVIKDLFKIDNKSAHMEFEPEFA